MKKSDELMKTTLTIVSQLGQEKQSEDDMSIPEKLRDLFFKIGDVFSMKELSHCNDQVSFDIKGHLNIIYIHLV